jgi:hypothetical protein
MSRNNITPIKVIPIPGINFNSNTVTVNKPIIDNDVKFDHIGTYIASSSSYSGPNTMPYNAFNSISDNFWQCDYANNPNFDARLFKYQIPYANDPYVPSKDGPSEYQALGGGSVNTKWTTVVGVGNKIKNIYGEWLQIQIPSEFPIFLFSYSILTPPPISNVMSFPKSFVIVGSMDGTNWNYVDQQIMKNDVDTTNRQPIVFNINSVESYCYFRLIITSLFKQNTIIAINQWALNAMTISTTNRDAFTTMSNPFSNTNKIQYLPIYEADSKYAQYNTSKPFISDIFDNKPTNNHELITNMPQFDYIYLVSGLVTTVLLYLFYKK